MSVEKEEDPGSGAASGATEALKWEDSDNEDETEGAAAASGGKAAARKKVAGPRSARQLLLIPGNESCCDCSSPDPKWASINLGITLCIACSGVHRSMGVHVSKVRSITLDAWEPEILKVMAELGNSIVNKIYEAQVPLGTGD